MFIEKIGKSSKTRTYKNGRDDIITVPSEIILFPGELIFCNTRAGIWSEKHQAYIQTYKTKRNVQTIQRRA